MTMLYTRILLSFNVIVIGHNCKCRMMYTTYMNVENDVVEYCLAYHCPDQ